MKVGLDAWVVEQPVHLGGGIEAVVVEELQVRRELHVDGFRQSPANELGGAVQGGEDLGRALAGDAGAQRLDETDGVLEVRAHPHFRHGQGDAAEGGLGDRLLAQHLDQGVTDQFAGAQLALGGAGRAALALGVSAHLIHPGARRGIEPRFRRGGRLLVFRVRHVQ